ncbi:MAG: hypothetical protein M3142_09735 [Bacteroidota bacterium]|nr:hypothetical protein [Bacteroidota bacterium]
MAATRTITQQIKFLLTAVTWCCVLLLNNQVITTYQPVPKESNAAGNSHLQEATKKEQTVVKQKVTFEATTSYFILHLAHFINWLKPVFQAPCLKVPESIIKVYRVRYFFRVLFSFIIIPNAP